MALQIAGGLHIPHIKKMKDESVLGMALICGTVETMDFTVVNIFDCQKRFEENIYGCIPVLSESS